MRNLPTVKYPLKKRSGRCRDSTNDDVVQIPLVRILASAVHSLADSPAVVAAVPTARNAQHARNGSNFEILEGDSAQSRNLRGCMCNARTQDRRKNRDNDIPDCTYLTHLSAIESQDFRRQDDDDRTKTNS